MLNKAEGSLAPPLASLGLVLALTACGTPPASASSGSVHLNIVQPKAGERLTVRSLSVEVQISGLPSYRLHYYLDGADQGEGDTSFTIFDVSPGGHTLEVEALDASGRPLNPDLRVGVDFTTGST